MAVWGAPVAREDDAERAVRAGLELVDAVTTLGPEIAARAGVLTGEAAVTIGAMNQGMVAGDLVNTASRLQSAADPGSVLVGEATQRAASAAIVFEPAGPQTLKGKQAPVPAWRAVRVVAERGGRNRSETLEAPFVGRDEELRLLKDLFHASAREGKSRLVSVMGPAGIGKTRLSWEFKKYLDGLVEEIWWHAGRSPAYGEGITFWALGEMVRSRAGLVETDDEATTRERVAAIVREHVADEEQARWIEAALLTLLGLGEGAPIDSDELFAAWRTFFEHLAAKLPVVMVFEETHHADAGLLDFIDHLMEWSRSSPIMVVTLARPELLERRPGLGRAANEPSPRSTWSRCSPAEMERLLGGLVPGLPSPAMERIVARADGVPLYAVETVRMLLAQGRLIKEGDDVPPGRRSRRPRRARDAHGPDLGAAGRPRRRPIGRSSRMRPCSARPSPSPAWRPCRDSRPEALEPRLRQLVRRELLVLDADARSPGRGHYGFVQALVREVAYNTLARKERKVRHLAAARHFETLGTDELAGGLAGHYLAAQRLAADEAEANALAAQARIALRGAAERAAELGSYAQARTFLEQALDVTTDPADRADLHERAYRESLNVLDPEPLLRHAAAAEAGAQEDRRPGGRSRWPRRSTRTRSRRPATTPRRRSGWSSRCGRSSPTWSRRRRASSSCSGSCGPTAASPTPNMRCSGSTASCPSRSDSETCRRSPGASRAEGSASSSPAAQARDSSCCGAPISWPSRTISTEVELSTRVQLTFYEQWGDPAAGLALGREGLEIGRQRGSRAYGFQMVGNSVICALRVGEWDWVAAILEEWLDVPGDENLMKEFRVDRALLHAQRGLDPTADIEAAAGAIAGVTDPQYESYEHLARAAASLTAGDLDAAIEHAERSAAITDYFNPLAMPLAARAALWAGDAATAKRLLQLPAMAAFSGPALEADRVRIAAGIAALEGRRTRGARRIPRRAALVRRARAPFRRGCGGRRPRARCCPGSNGSRPPPPKRSALPARRSTASARDRTWTGSTAPRRGTSPSDRSPSRPSEMRCQRGHRGAETCAMAQLLAD